MSCTDGCAPEPEIACTLAPGEVPERLAVFGRLRASALGVARTPDGMVLRFPAGPATEAELREFARLEQGCCTFWRFDVTAGAGDEVVLRWEGPPQAGPLLDALHAAFTGAAPFESAAGLL